MSQHPHPVHNTITGTVTGTVIQCGDFDTNGVQFGGTPHTGKNFGTLGLFFADAPDSDPSPADATSADTEQDATV